MNPRYHCRSIENLYRFSPLLVSMTEDPANNRKRSRVGQDFDQNHEKPKNLTNFLTSFLLMEEQEKNDRNESNLDAEENRIFIEKNNKRKTQNLIDFYPQIQDSYSDVDNSNRIRVKKSRLSTATAVAVAVDALESVSTSGAGSTGGHPRRLWVKDRSRDWWDRINHPDYPEEEFRQAFRMGRDTFNMICEELGGAIAKEDTTLRAAIPVRQRVAVCIWRLATGEPLRLVSKRFGLGISTCHKLVLEVCSAIRKVLMPKFLQWPDDQSIEKIKEQFEVVSRIPNVVGSMYTTHIPIIAPKISVAAYFNKRHTERNQKTSYSITVQGVVDPKGIFTDVCIGYPGSMLDDEVLEKSALYRQRGSTGLLNGVWIVGTSGYPLMDWLLVPYTQQHLTWPQHAFNEKIGEIQKIAKDAFMRLKGRWTCLQKRTEVKLQDLPIVLGACCVLHNICEMRNETMNPSLNFELIDDEMVPEAALRSVHAWS